MFQAHLPIDFWGEYILTANYLINMTPSVVLKGKNPYKILFGQPLSYNHIRTFGCFCYVHKQLRDKDKFASRSRRCVFVGYPFDKKGWKMYDLDTSEYLVTRDVAFVKTNFPYATQVAVGDNAIRNTNGPHLNKDWETVEEEQDILDSKNLLKIVLLLRKILVT
jgi:hypothetical protein